MSVPRKPATSFFSAIADEDEELALEYLRTTTFPDSSKPKVPSGIAEVYIDSGEYDEGEAVRLVCLNEDHCFGAVRVRRSDGFEPQMSCSRMLSSCTIKAHERNNHERQAGWYIPMARNDSKVFTTPYLPLAIEGGPISDEAGIKLVANHGIRLTPG